MAIQFESSIDVDGRGIIGSGNTIGTINASIIGANNNATTLSTVDSNTNTIIGDSNSGRYGNTVITDRTLRLGRADIITATSSNTTGILNFNDSVYANAAYSNVGGITGYFPPPTTTNDYFFFNALSENVDGNVFQAGASPTASRYNMSTSPSLNCIGQKFDANTTNSGAVYITASNNSSTASSRGIFTFDARHQNQNSTVPNGHSLFEVTSGYGQTKFLIKQVSGSTNVGIGTTNPGAKLDVEGNAVIGSTLNTATGQWAVAIGNDNTSSGLDSLATGETTTASGRQSFSGGFSTTASGNASFAVGGGTTASGENAFAACGTTVASGISSAAFGAFSEATATNSFATGGNTRANGESSFSTGVSSTAHGLGSAAFGLSCNSYNLGSISGGTVSSASNYSIGWGDNANATSTATQAFGYITTAAGPYSMAAGFNNITGGSASAVFGQQNNFDTNSGRSLGSGFLNTLKASDSAVFGSFNGFTWNTSSIPFNQFMLGKYLNVPRAGSNGAASDSCTIVGKHNGYTNLSNAAFVVGTGVGVGAEANSFTVQHDGNVLMEQIVNKNFVDDAAAATGGVPVGGVYHNSGDLKIRLT